MRSVRSTALWRLLVLLVGLVAAASAQAQSDYAFTDLGTLSNGTTSEAFAINEKGHVTGYSITSANVTRAFSYFNGEMTDLGGLSGNGSSAGYTINSQNTVGGNASFTPTDASFSANIAVRMGQGKVLRNGGASAITSHTGNTTFIATFTSSIFSLNDAGMGVGAQTIALGTPITPSTPTSAVATFFNGTGVVRLPDLGGTPSSAYSINNLGQIVGAATPFGGTVPHATLISANHKVVKDLGALPGGNSSVALAINENGAIVGYSATAGASGNHAFLYTNGALSDLGTLGGAQSIAQAINNNGDIVGVSQTAGSPAAFLYTDGTMQDINDLSISDAAGYTFVAAYGINDVGQIVGTCTTPDSHTHGFLLTPTAFAGVPTAATPLTDTVVPFGENLTLDPGITGGAPLTYQWFKDGLALRGQTGPTLTLTRLKFSQAGNYALIAVNLAGRFEGRMHLQVVAVATVTRQPVNVRVAPGKTAQFLVGASGSGTITYQWQMSTDGGTTWADLSKGSVASGVSSPRLLLAHVTVDYSGYQFRCAVTNSGATANSNAATLTVGPPPP